MASAKLNEALTHLDQALSQYDDKESELNFLTVSKAFEIVLEYAWRGLKRKIEDEGLEAQSPKTAIKQAAKLGLITHPEIWLTCLTARNDSVHDYFGISMHDYVELARKLIPLARKARVE